MRMVVVSRKAPTGAPMASHWALVPSKETVLPPRDSRAKALSPMDSSLPVRRVTWVSLVLATKAFSPMFFTPPMSRVFRLVKESKAPASKASKVALGSTTMLVTAVRSISLGQLTLPSRVPLPPTHREPFFISAVTGLPGLVSSGSSGSWPPSTFFSTPMFTSAYLHTGIRVSSSSRKARATHSPSPATSSGRVTSSPLA